MRYMKNNNGFTLIEILVVIAISAILMGLIMGPVVKSFTMTRQAQAMVQAQDSARFAMEQISRELSTAMYVYDNANSSVAIPVDASNTAAPTDSHTGYHYFLLPYAKIDFVLPKMVMHCNAPDHFDKTDKPRDYDRGDEAWPSCPYCGSDDVEARPKLPLEQSSTIVRYFLGLKHNVPPVDPTSDPPVQWQSPLDNDVEVGMENQVVLYRIEIDLSDTSLFPSTMSTADKQKIVNDPLFFYNKDNAADGVPYCQHWAIKARVVGMGDYEDLVVGTTDSNNKLVALSPTVTFRMAQVDNDTFSGTYSSDKAFEYPDAIPTVYKSKYGYWAGSNTLTVYRDNYNVAYSTYENSAGHIIIKKWENPDNWTGSDEFDITNYADNGSLACMSSRDLGMAFTYDSNKGTINFALDPRSATDITANNPVISLNTKTLNDNYKSDYANDRGSARRMHTLYPDSCTWKNATIVPGSEHIVGPDANSSDPMDNYIRYERVPLALGDPGPNQYKIDYDNGLIYFSSVYDQELPQNGNSGLDINAYFKVQFNKSKDIVRGDYGTKSLVHIQLGMRIFDPDSGTTFPVELNNSVKIQNALR